MSEAPKKKLSWKAWAGIGVAVIVIGSITGAFNNDTPTEADAPTSPAYVAPTMSAEESQAAEEAKAKKAAEKEAKKAEKAQKKASKEKATAQLPKDVQKAWLDGLGGLGSFQEFKVEDTSLIPYISQIKPIDQNTVRVTVQVPTASMTDIEKDEMKSMMQKVGKGCLNIGGFEIPELTSCEIETADLNIIEAVRR